MFILPEVADENNWNGGFDHMFSDNAKKFVPSFTAYSSPLAYYNTNVIKPGELKLFEDLLDPKWKGKIALVDPRGGSTAVSMAIVYQKFGEDFIRNLLTTQSPVIVRNSTPDGRLVHFRPISHRHGNAQYLAPRIQGEGRRGPGGNESPAWISGASASDPSRFPSLTPIPMRPSCSSTGSSPRTRRGWSPKARR